MSEPAIHLQYGTSQAGGHFQKWLDTVLDDRVAPAGGTLVHIMVGPDMSLMSERMFRDIEEQIALVKRLAGVFITTQGTAWAQVLQQRISKYVPHDAQLSIRVLHPGSFYEHTETWECSTSPPGTPCARSFPSSASSSLTLASHSSSFPPRSLAYTSVTISIDGLIKPILSRILVLPRLKNLTVHGPLCPVPSIAIGNYHRDGLSWFLSFSHVLQNIQRVIIPLDFFDGIQLILEKLQSLRGITSLELTMYTRLGYLTMLQSHRRLDIALEKGLENLIQLEELILPIQMITPNALTLVDLMNRMFRSSSQTVDGRGIRYYNPARDLLYGTPVMLLPGRIF